MMHTSIGFPNFLAYLEVLMLAIPLNVRKIHFAVQSV